MKTVKNPRYNVAVTVDLYENSTPNKFDAFASRVSGSNIAYRNSRSANQGDSRTYNFSCTETGVGILLARWNKRLGSGISDAAVSVTPVAGTPATA